MTKGSTLVAFMAVLLGQGSSFLASSSSSHSQQQQQDESRAGCCRTVAASASSEDEYSYSYYSKNTQNNNNNNNNNGFDAGSSLSVTELKRLLSERGVDFRDCLEKRDLLERLQESRNNNASRKGGRKDANVGFLTDQERSVIGTFKRVSPSVAYIQTIATVRGPMQFQAMKVPAGTGSGFLWNDRGHVVTNYHVLTGGSPRGNNIPRTVQVKLSGMAAAREAVVVGVEPEKDLAVLKLSDASNLPRPIDVGTSNDLQVGQSVLCIGNPFGLDDTLTTGVVSAVGRDVDGIGGRQIRGCIQTDAAINPGNSGGPLLDSRGRLIGVNTAIFSPNGGGNVGIGFAIPVDTVRRVVNQIIRYGRVVRPTLGVTVMEDRLAASVEAQLNRPLNGVLVADVLPNSPAEGAGIRACRRGTYGSIELGDVITGVDGEPVKQAEDLISAIEEKRNGDFVRLRILRNADPRRSETVRVKLTTSRDDLLDRNNSRNRAGGDGRTRSVFSTWQ